MLLSIITINFNNRKGLSNTFNSVFGQTSANFEYLVVDGGSTDGSVSIIEEHKNKLAYAISEADNGIYQAMNKGAKRAKGKYLLFLNSGDTLYKSTTIEELLVKLADADIYYSQTCCVYTSKERAYLKTYPKKVSPNYLLKNCLNHQNSLIKRELLNQFGFYDENYKLLSDWDFIFNLSLKGANFTYLSNFTISNYCLEGLSSKYADAKKEWHQILKAKYPQYASAYQKSLKKEKTLWYRTINKLNSKLLKLKMFNKKVPNSDISLKHQTNIYY